MGGDRYRRLGIVFAFHVRVVIDIAGWGLFLLFMFLSEVAQSWAIRHYNNTVRTDFYFTLLGKSHCQYHAEDTGVYLSWMTNDIKQIETMAWKPLFACIGYLAHFTLLGKSHCQYHAEDTGVYLSWMTNDIKQIETMAWKPLFACIGYLAQVIWSVLALFSLHWSLAVFSLAVAVVMYAAPKLFTKGMEQLGKTCTDEKLVRTSKQQLPPGSRIF